MSRLLENHSFLKRLVFILLIIFPVSLFSQNIKVSVSDAGSDEHLPFANIYFKTSGIDLRDGRSLYINRALGHLHQVRFNVRSEITIFEFETIS
jgi:hypothetical protein